MTDPRDTRIAELEKEVARLSSALTESMLDAIDAKEASPPAPVAQEKPYPADEPRDLNGRTEFHRRHGLCACGVVLPGRCQSCAERKDPKPPEVEEPAIVQTLRHSAKRDHEWDQKRSIDATCLALSYKDAANLLAFIDSRKAAVSELRSELADAKADVDTAVCNQDEALQRTYRLEEELSALKARTVVDVANVRADVAIAQEWLRLIQRDAPDVAHGPSQQQRARDALRAVDRALESIQPASANPPAPIACPWCGETLGPFGYLRAEREGRKA